VLPPFLPVLLLLVSLAAAVCLAVEGGYKVRNDTVAAQKLGQPQPFLAVFPQICVGQLASSFGPA
jgi:hypothetical protein